MEKKILWRAARNPQKFMMENINVAKNGKILVPNITTVPTPEVKKKLKIGV